jgi:formylglycine-generating enzyme required for sulfatase activity
VTRAWALLLATTACGGAGIATVPPIAEIPVAPAPRPRVASPAPRPAPAKPPEAALVVTVQKGECPSDMVASGAVCIDRYEAPNVAGEMPFALQTAYDGEEWCAARGKRLCTEDEWVRACMGPHGRPFPYGAAHRDGVCNDDHPWQKVSWKRLSRWPQDPALDEAAHLYQGDMSGARAECVSEEGAFDLTGNVAEWVRRSKPSPRPGYDHVLKGCFWAGCFKESQPSCAFTNGAHPGTFRTYEAGFRCCKPKAPKDGIPSGAR